MAILPQLAKTGAAFAGARGATGAAVAPAAAPR
jgi:hypothetical protein